MCIRWVRYYNVWMDGPFEYLEPEFVERTTDEYHKEFIKVQKYYKNKIKADQVSSNLLKFRVSIFGLGSFLRGNFFREINFFRKTITHNNPYWKFLLMFNSLNPIYPFSRYL